MYPGFIFFLFFTLTFSGMGQAQTAQMSDTVRTRKWREDIAYFKQRFPAYDKTLTPLLYLNHYEQQLYYYSDKSVLEEFIRGADSLSERAESLSDEELMIGLCQLVALSPNAHSRLYLFRVRTILNNLPLGLYWFGNDLHIVSAPEPYKELLGARVKSINGHGIDSVKKAADRLTAGNESWKKYMSLYFLRSPQAVRGLNLGTSAAEMQLTVQPMKGKERTLILQGDFVPQRATQEVWKELSPVSSRPDSLVHLLGRSPLPLYLQGTDKYFYHRYLEREGLLYLQFNRNENMKEQTFRDHVQSMIAEYRDKPFRSFVLDLRFNTGGNNDVSVGALEELARHLSGKKVYIFTGPATFSAGIVSAAVFKKASGARIIGEPAGDGLVFLSEGGNVVLPHSKLNAHYANGFHHWNFNNNFSIAPDVVISTSFKDYLSGKDPLIEYVLKN